MIGQHTSESELKKLVADGIRKTVSEFRKHPHFFFTETDIHAYFYHCLYSKRLDVETKDGVLTTCLHKEYPTNFRYSKKTMKDYGLERKGARGNYDMVLLNPQFIRTGYVALSRLLPFYGRLFTCRGFLVVSFSWLLRFIGCSLSRHISNKILGLSKGNLEIKKRMLQH